MYLHCTKLIKYKKNMSNKFYKFINNNNNDKRTWYIIKASHYVITSTATPNTLKYTMNFWMKCIFILIYIYIYKLCSSLVKIIENNVTQRCQMKIFFLIFDYYIIIVIYVINTSAKTIHINQYYNLTEFGNQNENYQLIIK